MFVKLLKFKSRPLFLVAAAILIFATHQLYLLAVDVDKPHSIQSAEVAESRRIEAAEPKNELPVKAASATERASNLVVERTLKQPAGLYFLDSPVGSNGYAPFIRNALYAGTSSEAFHAFAVLQKCVDTQKDMERLLKERAANADKGISENYTRLIEENLMEQRACQTVDGELLNVRSALLLKAAQGGELGASSMLLAGKASLAFDERRGVVHQLKVDADKGHSSSILMLAFGGAAQFGLSEAEQAVYRDASRLIFSKGPINKPLGELIKMLESDGESSETQEYKAKVKSLVDANAKLRQSNNDS